jgi:hypothetical protein
MTHPVRWAFLVSAVVVSAAATPGTRLPGSGTAALVVGVHLSPDSVSGVTGITAPITIHADVSSSGKALGSYTMTLTWDSTVVRLDSVRAGDFGSPLVNYVNGGEVRLTQVNTTGRAGAFSLAQLHYRFVSDSIGKRSNIQTTVSELTATDFTDLRPGMTVGSGVARILPPTVVARFSPDSIRERVAFKYQIDLLADFAQAPGIALGSYAAIITWDSTVMRLDSIRPGDYPAPQINQPNAAELRLTAADAAGRGGAAFSLSRMFFRFVDESFPRQSALTLVVTEMHAAGSFADLLPGVSARAGKALIGGVLRGDIDISGTIGALDAQLILQGVVGLALPAGARDVPHGDADCSATLRARDAQIVLNLVVGNDVSQFCAGRIE